MESCVWCGGPGPLVKSHIIAEALFRYANKADEVMAIAGDASPFVARSPTGIYSRFVCRSCEDRFKPHDDLLLAFSRAVSEGQPILEGEAMLFPRFDGGAIAKALVSVLFRAHHSDHRIFAAVKLGPYEGTIAHHLASEAPGCPANVSVMAHVEEGPLGAAVLSPYRFRWPGGANGYKLFLPHLVAWIRLDSRQPPEPVPFFEMAPGRPTICARGRRWNQKELARLRPLMQRHGGAFDRLWGIDARDGSKASRGR